MAELFPAPTQPAPLARRFRAIYNPGMTTVLNLLTRDGACYMAFAPHLTPDHYADLLEISESAATTDELRALVAGWAKVRGIAYSLDRDQEPAIVP